MKIRHAAWVIPSTLLAAAGTAVAQDSSSSSCTLEGGNYYCSQIDAISYSNFGTAGQYQRVTNMDSQGQCDFSPTSYGGGMAPFDDEVSLVLHYCLFDVALQFEGLTVDLNMELILFFVI
jgi:hypothetical protein